MVYSIICKDCISVYIPETGRSCSIVQEHKRAYKSGNRQSKHVNYLIDSNGMPYSENSKIIKSNCNDVISRIFQEGCFTFTRIEKSPQNEAWAITPEYSVLLGLIFIGDLMFEMHV